MTYSTTIRVASLALSLVGAAVPGVASQTGTDAAGCYVSWIDAAPVVARERLVAVSELSKLARQQLSGDLVKTTLCAENGRFVYRVILREPAGGLRNLTVDARNPFSR